MTKLEGGWINEVRFENGVVVKRFEDNGVQKSAKKRLKAEVWALKYLPQSPMLLGVNGREVIMEYLQGERFLDRDIRDMPEFQQRELLYKFGQTLRQIHQQYNASPDGYDERVVQDTLSLLNKVGWLLQAEEINTESLANYIVQEYTPQEKLVMTHGDYWLNNFIVEQRDGGLALNGVIDWEMGGMASPYEDFALIELSTERVYGEVAQAVWEGYGQEPNRSLQRWFSIRKSLVWMVDENLEDLSSEFYQDKVRLIKETI